LRFGCGFGCSKNAILLRRHTKANTLLTTWEIAWTACCGPGYLPL
jgi:hypothetical protein